MVPLKTLLLLAALVCAGSAVSRKKVIDMTKIILRRVENPSQYNKNIMPPTTYGGPVNIGISVHLRTINIDQKNMLMTVDLTFRMHWQDNRLRFTDSPDVDYVRFSDYTKLWIPDPFFVDSIKTEIVRTVHPEAFVRVNSSGAVLFSSRMMVTSHCPMNLRRFPHDEQQCPITIASYGYTSTDMVFYSIKPIQRVMRNFMTSGRFSYRDSKVELCSSKTSTGEYSCLRYNIGVTRITSAYILEWYIPCSLMVIVSFFSHLVPAEIILARIILTLAPLLTLATGSITYSQNLIRLSYSTANDVYTGISIMVIFFTLIHVVVTYYVSTNRSKTDCLKEKAEEKLEGEERLPKRQTKLGRLRRLLKRKGDLISRIFIIGFYCVFICLYLIAYCN